MEKLTFFFDEEVQKVINSFSHCFNVEITIFSSDFKNLLLESFHATRCEYCRYINTELGMVNLCDKLDQNMGIKAEKNPASPMMYTCHSGLVDAVIPLRLREVVIGYAFVGQFRMSDTIPAEITKKWLKLGFEPEILQKAFIQQPFFDKTSAENMLNLFSILCSYIVSNKHVKTRNLGVAEQVTLWIEDHISEVVSLDDLAYHLGLSRSTISHTVKKQLCISFRELCILKKIQHFENLIMNNPVISIKEAANQAGYSEPAYFSRIYKKVRLVTPSEFVTSVRSSEPNSI